MPIGVGLAGGRVGLGLAQGGGSGPTPWYLSGGIAASACIGAWLAKGAASYVASKSNLVTPGTNDMVDGSTPPTWAALTGWTGANSGANKQSLTSALTIGAGYSIVIEVANQTNTTASASMVYTSGGSPYIARFAAGGIVWWHDSALGQGTIDIRTGRHTLIKSGKKCYVDGVLDKTIGAGTPAGGTLVIGTGALGAAPWLCDVISVAIYNTTIDAAVAALTAAMAAL